MLKSAGMNTAGAALIFTALGHHPALMALDVAHANTTKDLDARYNYIEDGAVEPLIIMLTNVKTLRSFTLGVTAISREGLNNIKPALRASNLFH